jgi:hypothetical protein
LTPKRQGVSAAWGKAGALVADVVFAYVTCASLLGLVPFAARFAALSCSVSQLGDGFGLPVLQA